MVERTQPLAGIARAGRHGPESAGGPGVTLSLPPRGSLWQVAPWAGTFDAVAAKLAAALGAEALPAPGRMAAAGDRLVAHVEPLKYWVMGPDGAECPLALDPEEGATLDLSHNDSAVRVTGPKAADLIARLCPIDLRERSFPPMSFASTQAHHMITRVLRTEAFYEVWVMRSFAQDMWELLTHHAEQFGLACEL